MLSAAQLNEVIGEDAYGSDGAKIGRVDHVFVDDETGQPAFLTVATGLFGRHHSFVPVNGVVVAEDRVELPVTAETIKRSPHADVGAGGLTQAQERQIYQHYDIPYSERAGAQGAPDTATAARPLRPGESVGAPGTSPEPTERDVDEPEGQTRLRTYAETDRVGVLTRTDSGGTSAPDEIAIRTERPDADDEPHPEGPTEPG